MHDTGRPPGYGRRVRRGRGQGIRHTPPGRRPRRGQGIVAVLCGAVLLAAVAAAGAGGATVLRLSASSGCPDNPNCAPGLRATYGVNVLPVLVRTTDTGFAAEALDSGQAQVAIVFSSNPDAARPDLLILKDDLGMIGPRSEERRVGKECRSRWSREHYKKEE